MINDMTCGDPAALAGYLYDECEAAERARIEAHLRVCGRCAADVASLGATRQALASWAPPDVELGFRLTSDRDLAAGRVLRPARWWQRPLPAWAQAAAAVLIFAAGAAIGIGTRAVGDPAAAPAAASVQSPASATAVTAADLAALEQRVRDLVSAQAGAVRPASGVRAPAAAADDATVARVRALLAESEQRQERQLAFRLAQVVRDLDRQRTMDMARIERTFGQMEGVTQPELAEQREAIRYLIQRTGARVPRE